VSRNFSLFTKSGKAGDELCRNYRTHWNFIVNKNFLLQSGENGRCYSPSSQDSYARSIYSFLNSAYVNVLITFMYTITVLVLRIRLDTESIASVPRKAEVLSKMGKNYGI
jgi:hypothetical protein